MSVAKTPICGRRRGRGAGGGGGVGSGRAGVVVGGVEMAGLAALRLVVRCSAEDVRPKNSQICNLCGRLGSALTLR